MNIQPALITVTVVDDGVGLPVQPMRSDRLGHRLMRYHAHMLHAKLTIAPVGTRYASDLRVPPRAVIARGG